jgi:salicylate hydroxylase
MAVEDGAALAEALDLISSPSQLPHALRLWETVRMERAGQMQEASLINGKLWHFADGPEQRTRDAGTSAEVNGKPFERSPNQWSDRLAQRWTYGYDATGIVTLVGQAMGLGRKGASSCESTVHVNGRN